MSIKKVWLFSFIVVLLTASCAKDWFTTYNGNMPSNERIAQVALGQSKEDVYANLGARLMSFPLTATCGFTCLPK